MAGVVAVSLADREIDEYETIKNVNKLLTKDFDRYLNFSGSHRTDLSSPMLDPTGASSHGGVNHTEEQLVNGTAAANCVSAISDAINDCDKSPDNPHALFLYYRYVKKMTTTAIGNALGFQDAQYYRLRKDSMLEFAQRMEIWKKRNHATDIRELIVWKDNSE
ncbi:MULTISPECIES: ArpU family phage packaging/lysis transcriptional regulator [Lactobacillus]|uniref:Transcriptional regulator n=1 Tax=Lactobacillus xujianguonis TaxID=2495899 RepID=A0A437SSZ7_9LACO|nr:MULTISPECIES: ArpU family phage packaging/lysis transcriptional regulator [Lactobacillus]RVU70028.1 hypothetical protein EJK17_09870 [Lactobacillus xujianguonis]RVU73441.1 hypothetical protein EJK20_08110 [Lactobacillus xujianguonis]